MLEGSLGGKLMKNRILKWLLFAFTFVFLVYMGAGLFEAVVIVPVWSASTEAARSWNSNPLQVIEGGRFFMIISPVSILLALPTLILGWNAPRPLRSWLRVGLGLFVVLQIATIGWFVPEQMAIKGVEATKLLTDAELASRTSRWASLNLVRAGYAFVTIFVVLKALVYTRVLEGYGISCIADADRERFEEPVTPGAAVSA